METFPTIPEWITLEHQVAEILTQQEIHGWYFDERAARELESTLRREYRRDYAAITNRHPFVKGSEFTPKRANSRSATLKEQP